jgi:hypothetical protein
MTSLSRFKQSAALLAIGIGFAFLILLLIGSGLAHWVAVFLAAFCLALGMIMVLLIGRARED